MHPNLSKSKGSFAARFLYFVHDLQWRLFDRTHGADSFPLLLANPHHDYALFLIQGGLTDLHATLSTYHLPFLLYDWTRKHLQWTSRVARQDLTGRSMTMQAQLFPDQLAAFNTIVGDILADPTRAHFFLQGPGGSGKTFLYRTLTYHYRGLGHTVLCVASTGIAALLLPDGRTSHSQFKIPIDLDEQSISSITKQSMLGQLLAQVSLIIWDEVPMQHRYCFEVVNKLLNDIKNTPANVIYGGIPVIHGGDFAQILPVVPHGTRADIVNASLQRSSVWPRLKILHLRGNRRVQAGAHGTEFVDWVGRLSYDPTLADMVQIPEYIHQPRSIAGLIDHVYPRDLLVRAANDPQTFAGRCLLSPLNTVVTELNNIILGRLAGTEKTYQSVDEAVADPDSDGEIPTYTAETLQSIDVASLPPSQLHLKVGTPVMLLRNLHPESGLCNGTRMVVTLMRPHCLQVRLLGGDHDGELRVIPRIKLFGEDTSLGIKLSRKQFPVRLSFAMTINKSQGQGFGIVGLDMRSPVFTHGQLYVACSRTSSVQGLSMLVPIENEGKVLNVVYPEVLEAIR